MTQPDTARIIIQVTAGVIPGRPMEEFTQRYVITSSEWDAAGDGDKGRLLAERNGAAQGYAALLMLQPDRVNWVNLEWTYV